MIPKKTLLFQSKNSDACFTIYLDVSVVPFALANHTQSTAYALGEKVRPQLSTHFFFLMVDFVYFPMISL